MPPASHAPSEVLRRHVEGVLCAKNELDLRITVGGLPAYDAGGLVGLNKESPPFVIDGFRFHLLDETDDSTNNAAATLIPLPGIDGPRPRLSGGSYRLGVSQDGTFVSMNGQQTVRPLDGRWEMIWRDDAPAGLIICAFRLDEDARRNDSALEKGSVYVTFPTWEKVGLEQQREVLLHRQKKYDGFKEERDSQLVKLKDEGNILMKALHYRNAVAATADMDSTGLQNSEALPSDKDLLSIGDDLRIIRTGTVWTKSGPFGSSQQLLGSATLRDISSTPKP